MIIKKDRQWIYLFIWKQFNTDLFCLLYFVSFCALFYFFTGLLQKMTGNIMEINSEKVGTNI